MNLNGWYIVLKEFPSSCFYAAKVVLMPKSLLPESSYREDPPLLVRAAKKKVHGRTEYPITK